MSLKLFTSSMIGCIGIHFAVKGYVDQGRDALEHNAEGLYFGEWVELLLDLETSSNLNMAVKLFASTMAGCLGIHFGIKAYLDQERTSQERKEEGRYFGEWVELVMDLERKKAQIQAKRDALEHNAEGLYFGEWVELLLDLERKKAKIQAKRDRANCEKWSKILRAIESKVCSFILAVNLVNGLIEMEARKKKLKAEINQKIPAELKAKMELLKNAEEKISKGEPMDKDLIEEVEQIKEELVEVLKAANLDTVGVTKKNVVTAPPELKEKIDKVNNEIYEEIERTISKAGICEKIELTADIGKDSSSEDREKAEPEIKQEILATLDVEALKEKVENLTVELGLPKDCVTQDKVGAKNGQF
ncbi:hypothetical protein M0R45_034460 [Rubus argutus]|uniref:Uncharacterized protein n=1 Tax=Rubus argutus TaxID=59490 RepID=A0AAW1VR59_RUBAR